METKMETKYSTLACGNTNGDEIQLARGNKNGDEIQHSDIWKQKWKRNTALDLLPQNSALFAALASIQRDRLQLVYKSTYLCISGTLLQSLT